MGIAELLENLDVKCYEYHLEDNMIKANKKSAKPQILRELTRITCHLTNKNITFDVLKNKSILIGSKDTIKNRLKRTYKNSYDNVHDVHTRHSQFVIQSLESVQKKHRVHSKMLFRNIKNVHKSHSQFVLDKLSSN